ncbi:histidine kinase dimerization/phosphoacceptor domain -containing protein [Chitinophaga sp.]|uniref:tetratricopeptide repeat-containing sensor histidine kinase n=1 Tax=Chitinophaga sp. TaxID=1869181 RepID=UPI0031E1DFEB
MRTFIIASFLLLTMRVPIHGQDSSQVLQLHQLGKSYLLKNFSPARKQLMDTAIDIFQHAIRLSDSLGLENLRYESMILEGMALCAKDHSAAGEKIMMEVVDHYHKKRDLNREANTWLMIARNVNSPNNDRYFEKAVSLYQLAHNKEQEGRARIRMADYQFQTSRFKLAETTLLQALDLLHADGIQEVANIYYLLSSINRYLGNYEKALSYASTCVENAVRYNDTLHIESYYGEVALVNDEMGRAYESSQWYRKCLEKRISKKGDPVMIFRTAGLLIRQLAKLNMGKNALALMDSLAMRKPPRTAYEKGIAAQNYAYCFEALQKNAETEKYLLSAIAYFKGVDTGSELISLANMDASRFYLRMEQFAKAHKYLDTALVHRFSDRLVDQMELFHLLFVADSALGNYATAVRDLQHFEFLKDSIYNERKSRQIEELTIQYETDKKEQSIRLLEKEKRIQQSELTKELNTKRWIIGVTLLLIVIIGLLINNSRLKQRTNSTLKLQQRQIEKKNNSLQNLLKEKEWLVREIHHRVKNNFHIVMGLLRTQAAYLQGEEAIQAITESRQRIQAMSLVHQKLYQSDNLSAINMSDYIHELIDHLKDSFHTSQTIQFRVGIEPIQMDVSHCVPLGLIVNEAITNAIRHAFPGKDNCIISVAFKCLSPNHYLLSIKDNGIGLPVGFDPGSQVSMGMKLIRGLGDDLDATLKIINEAGTEIRLDFICEPASNT